MANELVPGASVFKQQSAQGGQKQHVYHDADQDEMLEDTDQVDAAQYEGNKAGSKPEGSPAPASGKGTDKAGYAGGPDKPCTSSYRGVCWHKKSKKWQSAINVASHHIYLGSFDTEEEAARMFDKVALHVRGTKAKLNFRYQDYIDPVRGCLVMDPKVEQLVTEARAAMVAKMKKKEEAAAASGKPVGPPASAFLSQALGGGIGGSLVGGSLGDGIGGGISSIGGSMGGGIGGISGSMGGGIGGSMGGGIGSSLGGGLSHLSATLHMPPQQLPFPQPLMLQQPQPQMPRQQQQQHMLLAPGQAQTQGPSRKRKYSEPADDDLQQPHQQQPSATLILASAPAGYGPNGGARPPAAAAAGLQQLLGGSNAGGNGGGGDGSSVPAVAVSALERLQKLERLERSMGIAGEGGNLGLGRGQQAGQQQAGGRGGVGGVGGSGSAFALERGESIGGNGFGRSGQTVLPAFDLDRGLKEEQGGGRLRVIGGGGGGGGGDVNGRSMAELRYTSTVSAGGRGLSLGGAHGAADRELLIGGGFGGSGGGLGGVGLMPPASGLRYLRPASSVSLSGGFDGILGAGSGAKDDSDSGRMVDLKYYSVPPGFGHAGMVLDGAEGSHRISGGGTLGDRLLYLPSSSGKGVDGGGGGGSGALHSGSKEGEHEGQEARHHQERRPSGGLRISLTGDNGGDLDIDAIGAIGGSGSSDVLGKALLAVQQQLPLGCTLDTLVPLDADEADEADKINIHGNGSGGNGSGSGSSSRDGSDLLGFLYSSKPDDLHSSKPGDLRSPKPDEIGEIGGNGENNENGGNGEDGEPRGSKPEARADTVSGPRFGAGVLLQDSGQAKDLGRYSTVGDSLQALHGAVSLLRAVRRNTMTLTAAGAAARLHSGKQPLPLSQQAQRHLQGAARGLQHPQQVVYSPASRGVQLLPNNQLLLGDIQAPPGGSTVQYVLLPSGTTGGGAGGSALPYPHSSAIAPLDGHRSSSSGNGNNNAAGGTIVPTAAGGGAAKGAGGGKALGADGGGGSRSGSGSETTSEVEAAVAYANAISNAIAMGARGGVSASGPAASGGGGGGGGGGGVHTGFATLQNLSRVDIQEALQLYFSTR